MSGSMLARRGSVQTIDLKRVERAQYVTHSRRGRIVEYLLLNGTSGRTRIQLSHGSTPMEKDANYAAYLGLVSGILQELARARPDLTIDMKTSPLMHATLFTMGVAGFLAGAGLVIALVGTGLPPARIWAAAPIFLTLLAFGAVIALTNWPQKPVRLSPSQLQAVLMA